MLLSIRKPASRYLASTLPCWITVQGIFKCGEPGRAESWVSVGCKNSWFSWYYPTSAPLASSYKLVPAEAGKSLKWTTSGHTEKESVKISSNPILYHWRMRGPCELSFVVFFFRLVKFVVFFLCFYFDTFWVFFVHSSTSHEYPDHHFWSFNIPWVERCPCGIIVKELDCGFIVREFELQSHYYVHFPTNTLGKGMKPLILSNID